MTNTDNGDWGQVVEELLLRIEDLEGELADATRENKALRANVSRSVLRRLDAQLGEDNDRAT